MRHLENNFIYIRFLVQYSLLCCVHAPNMFNTRHRKYLVTVFCRSEHLAELLRVKYRMDHSHVCGRRGGFIYLSLTRRRSLLTSDVFVFYGGSSMKLTQ